MIAEGITRITELARQAAEHPLIEATKELYDGAQVDYQRRVKTTANGRELGDLLDPRRPVALEVSTLTGFNEAVKSGVTAELDKRIIHVRDYRTVELRTKLCDQYGVRDTLIKAVHQPIDAFTFDSYYTDTAKFIIGIQVAFYQTDNSMTLIKLASSLSAESSITVNDDGFSQTVHIKENSVTAAQDVKIPPRLKLIPMRTFAEPAPVESEFLVRFKQVNGVPSIALFNVDGTKWQGEIMQAIKAYLHKHISDVPILA